MMSHGVVLQISTPSSLTPTPSGSVFTRNFARLGAGGAFAAVALTGGVSATTPAGEGGVTQRPLSQIRSPLQSVSLLHPVAACDAGPSQPRSATTPAMKS